MKNERTVKLTLDKAKEWYKKGGELKEVALQAYYEEELISKPRSWEEFCKNYKMTGNEYFIDDDADILNVASYWRVREKPEESKNILPNREYAEAFLAMMQLMSLRKAWIGDWEPDWKSSESIKWCIVYTIDKPTINFYGNSLRALSFPTKETAEDFLNTFGDLIKQAKILL